MTLGVIIEILKYQNNKRTKYINFSTIRGVMNDNEKETAWDHLTEIRETIKAKTGNKVRLNLVKCKEKSEKKASSLFNRRKIQNGDPAG